jgi:hypothetical protein
MKTITIDMLIKMAKKDNLGKKEWNNIYGEERKRYADRIFELGYLESYHGGAVNWIGQGYRNENLMFWHNEQGTIFPYTEIDDYGSVPPCFLVGNGVAEFPVGFWLADVDHNNIIFLSEEIKNEIKDTLKPSPSSSKYKTCVIIQGEEVNVWSNEKDPKIDYASVVGSLVELYVT